MIWCIDDLMSRGFLKGAYILPRTRGDEQKNPTWLYHYKKPRDTPVISNINMIYFLFFVLLFRPSLCSEDPRELFVFDSETKVQCFYGTTSPVPGLDPAFWRQDEYGNLILNGLNGLHCTGCLTYTFDHRLPISAMSKNKQVQKAIAPLVKSVENCQVLSSRANFLKASSDDRHIRNVAGLFGCDAQTMSIFTTDNFEKAKILQDILLDSTKQSNIKAEYEEYMNEKFDDLIDEPMNDFEALKTKNLNLKTQIIETIQEFKNKIYYNFQKK